MSIGEKPPMEFRNHRTKKPKKEMDCSRLIPTEINLDIFSRLSFNHILECKRVCKNWQRLLLDPCFPRMHLRPSQFQLDDENRQGNSSYRFSNVNIMSFLFGCFIEREHIYVYGEYDKSDGQKFNKSITVSKPIPKIMGGMFLGLCDGLVLCQQPLVFLENDGQSMDAYVSLVVSNPMTREYVNLPKFNEPYRHRFMMFGFGYDSSTNVYKVVRIFYPWHQKMHDGGSFVGQIYVYTLGCRGSGWRPAGNIDHHLDEKPGVLANGALHWLGKNKNRILAFDLADEKFREIAAPPGLDLSYKQTSRFSLRVFGGWLCIHHKLNEESLTTDIWVLKKKNTTENSSCGRSIIGIIGNQHAAWSWTKEFSMLGYSESFITYLNPLAITKNGQLLLLQNKCILTRDEYRRLSISHYSAGLTHELLSDKFFQQSLVRYNPKTEALEKTCDTVMQLPTVGFPFIKSFLSLKDLGEKEANKI
ncbi:F-box protein At3g07870-like [Papaver somniferum]|uniref:F-box protein At3g07870-like n=1 Tax=Papaver somniferum TaxID=3469 RepID=UPI000E6F772D|nr:F-box protein At3g07870-like [Papaver somniferum]